MKSKHEKVFDIGRVFNFLSSFHSSSLCTFQFSNVTSLRFSISVVLWSALFDDLEHSLTLLSSIIDRSLKLKHTKLDENFKTYWDFFRLISLENYDFAFVIVLIHLFIFVTFDVVRVFHGCSLDITTENF